MAVCLECQQTVGYFDIVAGRCGSCRATKTPVLPEEDKALLEAAGSLTLTTEMAVVDPLDGRIGVVSGTCIYGQHLGKDIAAAFRDTFGGRVKSMEQIFGQARDSAMLDLRKHAASLGASGVVAISITHQELTGSGKSMVMVTATGTAVRRR